MKNEFKTSSSLEHAFEFLLDQTQNAVTVQIIDWEIHYKIYVN